MSFLENFGITTGQGKHYEEIIYAMTLLYNNWYNRLSAYLKHFQLTPSQMNVLMVVKHQASTDGISQVDIGKKMIATASNLTRLLDKLEEEELVTREAEAGDRRVNLVRITLKGSTLLDQVWPGYTRELERCVQGLDIEEQKKVSEIFKKWLKIIVN
ncbi:MAG TPA: MarR family winged helix-turn-helix transcriptional regulator [Candidatus Bathyarchaeia archaeon]|nr:MarR family winged helix-turn-helix transcriptional regulator [Candidatus Bathyarchaeia archaeon]